MTEDEAKKMRCCGPPGCGAPTEVITHLSDGTTTGHTDYSRRVCVGAGCMGWRDTGATTRWVPFEDGKSRILPGDTGLSSGEWVPIPPNERDGYCGLAGPVS